MLSAETYANTPLPFLMTFPSHFLLPIACVPARLGLRMESRDTAETPETGV